MMEKTEFCFTKFEVFEALDGIADSKRRNGCALLGRRAWRGRDKGMPNGLSFNWENMATREMEA